MRTTTTGAALVVALALAARVTLAQGTSGAGISGVVKDSSGAVLPGVTVEASSPALIEGTRTVVTDDQGSIGSSNCGRAPMR